MAAPGETDQEYLSRLLNPTDVHQKRSITTAESTTIRESLPKSGLSKVILSLNVCIQRRFELEKAKIHRREKRYSFNFDQTRRSFLDQQAKKSRVWKSQDEVQMTGMNFPSLRADAERKPSMKVLYTNPRYPRSDDSRALPLMPYEKLRRSRTEIVKHKHDIYTAKLPSVIDVDEYQLERFNTFCAREFIQNATRDSRFRDLDKTLQRKKSGSSSKFTRWMAKRYPDGGVTASNPNIDDAVKQPTRQYKRQTNVVFPSLQKNQSQSSKPSKDKALTEQPKASKTVTDHDVLISRGSSTRAYITEEVDPDDQFDGEDDESEESESRQFQSPSHKQTFVVKSSVVSQ